MSLLETNPFAASLIVHADGLVGLETGHEMAVAKAIRLARKCAAPHEVGNAVLDAAASAAFILAKLNAMAALCAAQIEAGAIPKGTEGLAGIAADLQANIDSRLAAEGAGDNVVPLTRTPRFQPRGPTGPEAA